VGKTSKNQHNRRHGAAKRARSRPVHRAVWQRTECYACRQPVITAEEDTGGGRLRGALIEADPDPRGVLVRDGRGYVVRDPAGVVEGDRWAWHNCPVRNAAGPGAPSAS
jgi:hypothetical protein